MSKIFLSYSSRDRAIAVQVKLALESKGLEIWFDRDQIAGGDYYAQKIKPGILDSKIFLLIMTSNSVGDERIGKEESKEVAAELGLAKDYGCKIIPLKADMTPRNAFNGGFEYDLRNYQYIDIYAAIELNDFDPIADEIERIYSNTERPNIESEYLKKVEFALKASEPEKALTLLNQFSFRNATPENVKFLKITAKILKYSLATMTKKQADEFSRQYQSLFSSEMFVPSAYMLGILSRYYYKANSITDPTAGFEELKLQAKGKGSLKGKYKLMAEHLLPEGNQYALDWKF